MHDISDTQTGRKGKNKHKGLGNDLPEIRRCCCRESEILDIYIDIEQLTAIA